MSEALRRFRPSRVPPKRDMDASPFAAILADLLLRIPGLYAAALVDREGETVDYTGKTDPFDIRVSAAHLQILVGELERLGALGIPRSLVVRADRRTLVARQLADGYSLVMLLRRRAGFTASRRAFDVCERALAREAGWDWPSKGAWHPIGVVADRRGRPQRLWFGDDKPKETAVEVMGALVNVSPYERGFRVRTEAGHELTVVREPRNCWYADERAEGGVG